MSKFNRALGNCGRIAIFTAFAALFFSPNLAQEQNSSIADHLPPNTWFYQHWRGMNSLVTAQKTNHLLELWADPDFAPVRRALVQQLYSSATKDTKKKAPTEQEFSAVLSLLENPLTIGFAGNLAAAKASPEGTRSAPSPGFFLAYDAKGKEAIVQLLLVLSQANSKEEPAVSSYSFGSTKVEKLPGANGDSYRAWSGTHFLMSDQKEIIEDLITRFRSRERSAASLAQRKEYQEIHPQIGPDAALEWFARIPDLSKLGPSKPGDKNFADFAQRLHLEQIHVMGGGVSFSGKATRLRGALLGDTSPGSLFDIFGPSGAAFATQPLASGGPLFSISRLDFAALYTTVRQAVVVSLNDTQAANFTSFESLAERFLGMPVADALKLFTGEFASVTSFSPDGTTLQLHAATIQESEEVLRVLRAVLGPMIANEDQAGSVDYLDLAVPYRDPQTQGQRRKFYYVAVTPEMIVVAPRKEMVREAVAQLQSKLVSTSGATSATPPTFAAMRSLVPAKLSGLGYGDLTQVPWDKLISAYTDEAAARAQKSGQPDQSSADWLKELNPAVFSRYLHSSVSGWWKDSHGVYFDSYVQ
ncbi:MAG: hypothetical protein WBC04_18920 [Candidatus Acidiferrales bacterium]